MPETKYLIVGASHAGLSALDAIRLVDESGSITMVNKDDALPYSPTVLPYVFSGMADPDRVFLRDRRFFEDNRVEFLSGKAVVRIDAAEKKAVLDDGSEISFQKALAACGSRPQVPNIDGLAKAPYHVLRSLDDALNLKAAAVKGGSAVILGAGLVGLHAAENLALAGVRVTVVEMLSQVLPSYFDKKAGGLIKKVFSENGVKILLGSPVTHVTANHTACAVSLENGLDISADMILVAAGVAPNLECLEGQGLDPEEGVAVDEYMRTKLDGIWAAGDLVRSKGFFDGAPSYSATLPMAVRQGRIAGASMAEDPMAEPFKGSIPLNAYSFFGNHAFSVGQTVPSGPSKGFDVDYQYSPTSCRYQKLVFKGDNLVGAMSINSELDPGVLWKLIQRKEDLLGFKKLFAAKPREVGRLLMTKLWR